MLAVHVSDTHGAFPPLPKEGEVVIHSGDILPTLFKYHPEHDLAFQVWFVQDRLEKYKAWLEDRPSIFVDGNHDWTNPAYALLNEGLRSTDATNRVVQFEGKSFYGFPFIPYIAGHYNYERDHAAMTQEIERMVLRLTNAGLGPEFDCLIAHCPPYGVLDLLEQADMVNDEMVKNTYHCGNRALTTALTYQDILKPKTILCGHFHGCPGEESLLGIKVSNAATTVRLVEI